MKIFSNRHLESSRFRFVPRLDEYGTTEEGHLFYNLTSQTSSLSIISEEARSHFSLTNIHLINEPIIEKLTQWMSKCLPTHFYHQWTYFINRTKTSLMKLCWIAESIYELSLMYASSLGGPSSYLILAIVWNISLKV